MAWKGRALGWWLLIVFVGSGLAAANDLQVIIAAKRGDREALRALLNRHADANVREADGATALLWAAYRDDVETADLLIRAGANVNTANDLGVSPLTLACNNGSFALIDKLLKAGANASAAQATGETALMTCVRAGSLDGVKALLARGANVNAKENRRAQTPLMWAAAEKHPEMVRALIERGADVNSKSQPVTEPWQFATYGGTGQDVVTGGFTPLMFAAQQGDTDSAKLLLPAGAKINDVAADGMTPLLVAASSGKEAMSIFLLEQGANPNAVDSSGIAALHYTVLRGITVLMGAKRKNAEESYFFRPNMPELTTALLAHGADPNVRMKKAPLRMRLLFQPRVEVEGATPYLLAAASGDAGIMRELVAAGADTRLALKDNTTPLMAAAGVGSMERKVSKEEEARALEAVKVAFEHGGEASINATNTSENGQGAMHGAAYLGLDSVIQFLADRGARPDIKDRCGQTPLNIALGDPAELEYITERVYGGHKSTAELLLKLGGDVPVTTPAVTCNVLGSAGSKYRGKEEDFLAAGAGK